jgi:hypothetical protein
MATFNLLRNSRVFFTTNVSAGTGIVQPAGFTVANSQELQVLDGFSFSQATNADTVQISEAGDTPVRGQRSFNTSLGNVEFSLSTYIRPSLSGTVKAEESHLWNALLSSTAIGTAPISLAFTTLTTVTLVAGLLTLTGTGLVATGLAVNDVVVVGGVVGVGASQYNTAIKIQSISGTVITAKYLTAPTAAAVAANWGATGVAKFSKMGWNENVAIAADIVTTPGIPVAYSAVSTAASNKNQLLPFGMVVTVDSITYVIDNCALDQAVIDFGLDGIATVAWTGKGTVLRQLDFAVAFSAAADPVISGGSLSGTIKGKNTTANFITNKLSTVTLISNIGGVAGIAYTLALTGGSITIANNIAYVTPANLGIVNTPIGYYTGTRAVSGSINAYLRTGTTNTAGLLDSLLDASATVAGVEPKFRLQIEIGGRTNGTRIEVEANGANIQIPTIDAQAVMSTAINFTAQGTDSVLSNNLYDIENTNDLTVRYLSL